MPSLPSDEEKFNKKVLFFEASTESITQFTISNIILRIYGVSDDLFARILQYFSLSTSILSLPLAFITVSVTIFLCQSTNYLQYEFLLQRQLDIAPMETAPFEKSLGGFCSWIRSKLLFLIYLLCISLPIGMFITTLLIVGIKRDSSEILPIFMTVLLHPIATIPFGILAKMIGKYISPGPSQTIALRILHRLFTYSLNVHLTLIAAVTFFLYSLWNTFQNSTTVLFSNKSFNQCLCNILQDYYHGEECVNTETQSSFQNEFLYVKTSIVLIIFLVTCISCHCLHSFLIWTPQPSGLLDYVLGRTQKQEKSDDFDQNAEVSNCNRVIIKGFKVFVLGLPLILMAVMLTSPFYSFKLYHGNGTYNFKFTKSVIQKAHHKLISDTICQTTDNYKCNFPFEYNGRKHYFCTFEDHPEINPGKLWCAIDEDIKSVGECKTNCDKCKLIDSL